MNKLRSVLGVAFGLSALVGMIMMFVIAAHVTAWVLYPLGVAAFGFTSYFLLDEVA